MIDGPTYFAWFVMALLFGVTVWLIVMLGSLPKKIALKRNHPQVDAINAASWIGLLLLGAGWPIAFVWAHLRSGTLDAAGGGTGSENGTAKARQDEERDQLRRRIADLEQQLETYKQDNR
jgi:hypothetical protein